jgi:hypothetical protein
MGKSPKTVGFAGREGPAGPGCPAARAVEILVEIVGAELAGPRPGLGKGSGGPLPAPVSP